MRAINHALTGTVIGLAISEPAIALPVAFLSHYVCDAIPHYGGNGSEQEEINSRSFRILLVVDALLCAALVALLALYRPHRWLQAALCAFLAASPDLFSIPRYRSLRKHKSFRPNLYERLAKNLQWFEHPIGAVVEVVWGIGMVVLILTISRPH